MWFVALRVYRPSGSTKMVEAGKQEDVHNILAFFQAQKQSHEEGQFSFASQPRAVAGNTADPPPRSSFASMNGRGSIEQSKRRSPKREPQVLHWCPLNRHLNSTQSSELFEEGQYTRQERALEKWNQMNTDWKQIEQRLAAKTGKVPPLVLATVT